MIDQLTIITRLIKQLNWTQVPRYRSTTTLNDNHSQENSRFLFYFRAKINFTFKCHRRTFSFAFSLSLSLVRLPRFSVKIPVCRQLTCNLRWMGDEKLETNASLDSMKIYVQIVHVIDGHEQAIKSRPWTFSFFSRWKLWLENHRRCTRVKVNDIWSCKNYRCCWWWRDERRSEARTCASERLTRDCRKSSFCRVKILLTSSSPQAELILIVCPWTFMKKARKIELQIDFPWTFPLTLMMKNRENVEGILRKTLHHFVTLIPSLTFSFLHVAAFDCHRGEMSNFPQHFFLLFFRVFPRNSILEFSKIIKFQKRAFL